MACRLDVLGNSECKRLLCATHNSDEVRDPSAKRRSARSAARCVVRGPPSVDKSEDQWPGKKTASRPEIAFPEGGPRAEPAEPRQKFVSLKSDLSAHARKVQSPGALRSPPQCVVDGFNGEKVSLPPRSLRALGLERHELKTLYSGDRCADW